MAEGVGHALAGAVGSFAMPLQAVQNFVNLYTAISDAQKAMTFHVQRGAMLRNRVRFVADQLRQKDEVLRADIREGRMTERDAFLFRCGCFFDCYMP